MHRKHGRNFLLQFGDTLYQVAGISTRNEDEAADCFVFVCEKLAENAFRRLLCFKPAGTASFSTPRNPSSNLCRRILRSKVASTGAAF
jgi:hypothetical protein